MRTDTDVDLDTEARDAHLRAMRRDRAGAGVLARRWGRQLLEIAGSDPDRAALTRAAERRFRRMPAPQRAALVEYTLGRDDWPVDTPAERHIDPNTIPPRELRRAQREEETVPLTELTKAQEARVRKACRTALERDPQVRSTEVRNRLAAEGLVVDGRVLYAKYFNVVRAELGIPRRAEAGNGKSAPTPPPPPPPPADVSIEPAAPTAADISPAPSPPAPEVESPAGPGPDAEVVRGPDRTAASDEAPIRSAADARLAAAERIAAGVQAPPGVVSVGLRVVALQGGQRRVEFVETLDTATAYRVAEAISDIMGKEVA